ncbi:MAG: hypothetical protein ABW157_04910 [Candidatus Thiodiazotropha sp. LLP2]
MSSQPYAKFSLALIDPFKTAQQKEPGKIQSEQSHTPYNQPGTIRDKRKVNPRKTADQNSWRYY